ncbi:metallophosphoesterase [Geotalea sp. SG265]|uniref:metallophosphoesterase family protein n=1 Tax=Geotalea sp. SG265 TaxID=2922867 RepID=UPI001FB003B7|nr:metallophosphoesterase [Geotalea sp. SG265]
MGRQKTLLTVLLLLTLVLSAFSHAGAASLFERSAAELETRLKKASADDYTFVVLGDSRDNDAVFRKVLAKAAAYQPLFILHLGDYSSTGSIKATEQFLSLLLKTAPGVPVFVVPGNHENMEVFLNRIGPLHFTLESKRLGLKVIALDNSNYQLQKGEFDYLQEQLQGKLATTFLAMHVPPKTSKWDWHTFSKGAAELEKLIAGSGIDGIFFAHVHLYAREEINGIPHIISGGAGAPLVRLRFPGEPVYHFVVVRVKRGKASMEMVSVD